MDNSITTLTSALSNDTGSVIQDIAKSSLNLYSNVTNTVNDVNFTSYSNIIQRDSLYIVVPVTIIYVSIFFTGTIGNISTCIVIARNKSMHTATNYYLFSLAVSDLLLLISGLPVEIYLVWCKYPYIFGEGFCILRGLAAETSTNASVLTITAFTIERYVAICHPFLSQTMSKLSRAIKLILVIWLVALSFALPQALQFGVIRYEHDPNMVMCLLKRVIVQHSFELSTFLFFVVPMSLITVLYALIGLKLRKSNMMKRNPGRVEAARNCRHHPGRSSRRVLKMLVAVVIAFFICWAPFHVQRLVAIYGTNTENHITSNSKWMAFLYLLTTYISGVLYYVSTTINPILYNIMSHKFRVAFMETLSRSCRVPGLAIRTEQRSYSSLSRSQQKAAGAYGSKTAGTAGSGIAHESTECSGNSGGRDESPKQTTSLMNHVMESTVESRNTADEKNAKAKREGNENGRNENFVNEESVLRVNVRISNGYARDKKSFERRLTDGERDDTLRSKAARYATVRVTNADGSGKKWWRLLKWLPGLKSLKLPRRTTYAVPENRILENSESHREEFSMTMWNIHEANEQRPV